jgi:ATP-dependent Clp protease ATP-binding subunit ClpC
VIQNQVEDRLSDAILGGTLAEGSTVLVDIEDEEFVIYEAGEEKVSESSKELVPA